MIAVKGICLANTSYLRESFAYHKTPVYLNAAVKDIDKGKVIITDENKKELTLNADDVIVSIGYNPAPLNAGNRKVHLVGDCWQVGNLRKVIWRAWDVAMKI